MNIEHIGKSARTASFDVATLSGAQRSAALCAMADALERARDALIKVNASEVELAREKGVQSGYLDRLTLNEGRIAAMAQGLRTMAQLPDPLGKSDAAWTRPNGLHMRRVRVPLGVVGIIFEARPNVTADAAGICLMSGNACILRGGSEAVRTNIAIVAVLRDALETLEINPDAVQLVKDTSREVVRAMMGLRGLIDVLIPRGGAELIRAVVEQAKVPVIETGAGLCHTYVDGGCRDFAMARAIIANAKCDRPSVCNAMETLLVDRAIAQEFLPQCLQELRDAGVELRGCANTQMVAPWVQPATQADWDVEYSDMILSVKVVDGMQGALAHIEEHGTRHSECIVTQDEQAALYFQSNVDAAAVYHNASTRFTDGFEFGFGAEIGISTQKLHARGPMGLEQLTTYKYIVCGDGQIRV